MMMVMKMHIHNLEINRSIMHKSSKIGVLEIGDERPLAITVKAYVHRCTYHQIQIAFTHDETCIINFVRKNLQSHKILMTFGFKTMKHVAIS